MDVKARRPELRKTAEELLALEWTGTPGGLWRLVSQGFTVRSRSPEHRMKVTAAQPPKYRARG
jgi:hypothetical protein